ncbi:tetratricopeptide repeat protein [Amphritea sp. 1_MG-2023]|uniref:tetratricopeptide repeat protein n=1 Tax=Amphritea sp. 1_MG-2023 TaxID=3062670 RepID=UPI0026E3AC7B|nr:tetratricopeptide repeat protein [Amphritea sp. 1_MG-2023]MDO6564569.1 tetratricopeptide repeat protein [Amphritea sp. 1_MG-2023]
MKRLSAFLLLLSLSVQVPVQAKEPELSEAFLQAAPRIKLYMAYAEYKMGHHELARMMWRATGGSGRAEALFNLGNLSVQGLSVEKNITEAVSLYSEAGRLGSRSAAYQLGLLYLHHPDLNDATKARHWLSVAAIDGDEDAAERLATLSRDEQSDDPLRAVEALLIQGETGAAIQHLQQLVESDPVNLTAATRLAWLYESGLGVERDISRAAQLFMRAAEGGNAEAQYALSVMYQTGVGQVQNRVLADLWLHRAAAQYYQPALDTLSASGSAD